jgi:glycine oxidase
VTPPGARYDAVVVGAGTIGLSCAWRLAQHGMAVAVVDPDPAHGASWVAAGMLAPVSEAQFGEEAFVAPALTAAARWPTFAAELAEASGRSVGYLSSGTLVVAADDDDRAWASELHRFQRQLGLEAQWLTGRQARGREPAVAPGVRSAVWVPGDHQVENRLLLTALLGACRGAGVELLRNRVLGVECAGGAVTGVALEQGRALPSGNAPSNNAPSSNAPSNNAPSGEVPGAVLGSRLVVLAAGCWSGDVGGLPDGAAPPVRPVKGQILRMSASERAPTLSTVVRAVVRGSSVYLVPRADGTVVVGATVEERGFDTAVTAGAVYELLRDAHHVVPGIAEMSLSETAAGLRPGSPDNAPIVGPPAVDGADGLVLATGHHRQGILLTPLTADTVLALVTGAEPPADTELFRPGRFAPSPAREGP